MASVDKYRNYKKRTSSAVLLSFISQYWLLLLLAIFGIPIGYRYWKNQQTLNQTNELNNYQAQNNAQNNIASPKIIKAKLAIAQRKYPLISSRDLKKISISAQQIAKAFGTNVDDNHVIGGIIDLYNVKAWTEDETTAVKYLKMHPGTFSALEDVYYNVHTKSKNLKADCYKYLSKSQLNDVRKSHLAHGNYKNL